MTMRTVRIIRNKVKGLLPACLFALLPLLAACDYIAEEDRLIEVGQLAPDPGQTPTATARNVLLEDFTGQRCPNCPTGTEVIEQLQEALGDRLVAVGIHGGPLGFKGTATVAGLATELGDEYYNHWNLEYQPVALIDRGPATNYPDWTKAVRDELANMSETKMEVEAALSGEAIRITVREERLGGDYSGKLQVWVVEDGIVAIQTMPDGTNNRAYVHNHVLRAAVNGAWGDDITLKTGESKEQSLTQAVAGEWNPANLSVVAFVYNGDGVEQVVKAKVRQ